MSGVRITPAAADIVRPGGPGRPPRIDAVPRDQEAPAAASGAALAGRGFSAIEREVCHHYRVTVIGRTDAVRERYYAISAERRLKHPGVVAITSVARTKIFA